MISIILRLLRAGVFVSLVTAAGYPGQVRRGVEGAYSRAANVVLTLISRVRLASRFTAPLLLRARLVMIVVVVVLPRDR